MPSRNIIKLYAENGYYHIYNRGVEKRPIFLDKKDCIVFQRFLKQYLSPKEALPEFIDPGIRVSRLLKVNMSEEIELLAFALMPNHFHLLVRQTDKYSIATFMKRLFTSYVKYFNTKYKRIGSLFQDTYKGSIILQDEYLLQVSRYIHLNPRKLPKTLINFQEFNSYPYYMGEKEGKWVHPKFVLNYFNATNRKGSYEDFVESDQKPFTDPKTMKELLLDDL